MTCTFTAARVRSTGLGAVFAFSFATAAPAQDVVLRGGPVQGGGPTPAGQAPARSTGPITSPQVPGKTVIVLAPGATPALVAPNGSGNFGRVVAVPGKAGGLMLPGSAVTLVEQPSLTGGRTAQPVVAIPAPPGPAGAGSQNLRLLSPPGVGLPVVDRGTSGSVGGRTVVVGSAGTFTLPVVDDRRRAATDAATVVVPAPAAVVSPEFVPHEGAAITDASELLPMVPATTVSGVVPAVPGVRPSDLRPAAMASPLATARPDAQLDFPAKDVMHLYFASPTDGRAAELGRVEGSLGPLGTYIRARQSQRILQNAPPPEAGLASMPPVADGRILARHAYSECGADGFWHVVEDTWYDAGGGQIYKRRTHDQKTEQPCGEPKGAVITAPIQVRQLVNQPMDPRDYGEAVEDGLTVEVRCNRDDDKHHDGLWFRYVYRRFRLKDGSIRRHHSPERIEHTGVRCDQPMPPPVAPPAGGRIVDAPPVRPGPAAM